MGRWATGWSKLIDGLVLAWPTGLQLNSLALALFPWNQRWEFLLSAAESDDCHEKWQRRYAPSGKKKMGERGSNLQTQWPMKTPPPSPTPPLSVRTCFRLLGAFTFADESGAVWGCADASSRVRFVNWLDCLCTIIETAGQNHEQTCGAAVRHHTFHYFPSLYWSLGPQGFFSSLLFLFFIIFYNVLLRLFDGTLIKLRINLPHTSENSLFSPKCGNKHATLRSSCLPTCRLSRYLCLFRLSNRVKLRVK